MVKKSKVKVRELDMSKADGYAISENDVIYEAIRDDEIKNESLLFSGLEGENLAVLLEYGTLYPNSSYIYARDTLDNDSLTVTSPLTCAWERKRPLIAVYDKIKFKSIDGNEYVFLDSNHKLEALLAAYLLI